MTHKQPADNRACLQYAPAMVGRYVPELEPVETYLEQRKLEIQHEGHQADVKPQGPEGFDGFEAIELVVTSDTTKETHRFMVQFKSSKGAFSSLKVDGQWIASQPRGDTAILKSSVDDFIEEYCS